MTDDGYTWITDPGGAGRRVVKRHTDGLCAVVHHDPRGGYVQGPRGFHSPVGGAAFEAVVDEWVPEGVALRRAGPQDAR